MKRIIVLFLLGVTSLFATIIRIPEDWPTIQDGIETAVDGDTILLGTGSHIGNILIQDKSLVLGSERIFGDDVQWLTQLTGFYDEPIITIENDSDKHVEIIGLTIRDGFSTINGGGIYCGPGSRVSFSHCAIQYNVSTDNGGGIYCEENAAIALHDVVIRGNRSVNNGGGIYFGNGANGAINRCLIVENDCRDIGSDERGSGTAIFCDSTQLQITSTTIADNNTYSSWMGGPYVASIQGSSRGSLLEIVNSIQHEDHLSIFQLGTVTYAYTLVDNIVSVDTVNDLEGNLTLDPGFAEEEGIYRLSNGSVCIDAGTAFFVWEDDTLIDIPPGEYDGVAPDMGAYEFGMVVVEDLTAVPVRYSLLQNYPNPFNPVTTIGYSVPEQSKITLTVFDIRGEEVMKLLNKEKPPGNYEVLWNGLNESGNPVSTGVYFARLEAREFSQTIKMVYLK